QTRREDGIAANAPEHERNYKMGDLTGPSRTDRATHDVDFNGPSGNGTGSLNGPNGQNSSGGTNNNSSGPNGQNGGTTGNGIPIQGKPKPTLTPLNLIPDVEHQAPPPEPLDETILAASPQAPQRKPLQNSALGGSFPSQNGITGYAGVFIP